MAVIIQADLGTALEVTDDRRQARVDYNRLIERVRAACRVRSAPMMTDVGGD